MTFDGGLNHIKRTREKAEKETEKRVKRVQNYRKEVSRKAAIANKRLRRLEDKGIKTPAYEKWLSDGGEYFSVKGKTYREVQSELARIENYLESATSTLTGAKKVVKEMIDNTGMDIQWSNWEDMKEQTSKFFNIASQVEQYYRTVEDSASSIGYQKIWEAINKYLADNKKDLSSSTDTVDSITADVVKAMKEFDKSNDKKFTATGENYDYWNWSILPKDKK